MPGIPASNTTSSPGLVNYPAVYYDKVGVDNFKANTPALELCDQRPFPKRSGRFAQNFGYVPFAANTTPATEGLTGSGLPLTTVTSGLYLDQYVDFISYSDVLVDTQIDPIVTAGATELGYRAALTVNTIVFTQFDTSITIDSNSDIDLAAGEFVSSATIRRAEMSLDAINAKRRAGGMFGAAMSPLMAYDLLQDSTAGGLVDVIKRHEDGEAMLQGGTKNYQVADWSGVRIVSTTTVPTTSNYQSSGNLGYHAYVVGENAFLYSSLANQQLPKSKDFAVMTSYFNTATPDNPAMQVAAANAYNFLFGVGPRPNTNSAMPYRRIRAEVSIT